MNLAEHYKNDFIMITDLNIGDELVLTEVSDYWYDIVTVYDIHLCNPDDFAKFSICNSCKSSCVCLITKDKHENIRKNCSFEFRTPDGKSIIYIYDTERYRIESDAIDMEEDLE